MTLMVGGLAAWILLHLLPVSFRPLRSKLIERVGPGPYKGIFALLMLGAVALMIFGWRETGFIWMFEPPVWIAWPGIVMVIAGFLIAGGHGSNLRRVIRHPQLYGVALWGFGHVMVTGDARAAVLFGGLATWATVTALLVNRRDGAWVKPEPLPRRKDVIAIITGVGGGLVFVLWLHQWLFGFSPVAWISTHLA